MALAVLPVCLDTHFGEHHVVLRGLVQDHNTSLQLPSSGMTTWDCGALLANHLVACPQLVRGAHVVELGCGLGLNGIMAARLGAAALVATDGDADVLEAARANYASNFVVGSNDTCAFAQLYWGRGKILDDFLVAHAGAAPFDVVLAADCLYQDYQVDLLLDTIHGLFDHAVQHGRHPTCIIGFSRRGIALECVAEAADKRGLALAPMAGWSRSIFGEECGCESEMWSLHLLCITPRAPQQAAQQETQQAAQQAVQEKAEQGAQWGTDEPVEAAPPSE